MITVAGFNSAIDRLVDVGALRPGTVHRAGGADERPGGKGVHVAQTIAALGMPVTLVGLCDDAHAAEFSQRLKLRGVDFRAVRSPVPLRQCLAIREASGRITEILERSEDPGADTRMVLDQVMRHWAMESDALVCTGSLPPGFDAGYYARVSAETSLPCAIDASGDALRAAADGSPWLLKPNAAEAADLLGAPVASLEDAAGVARALHARGVRHAVLTLGGEGAVAVDEHGAWQASLHVDGVRNTVGSGDCFLGGLMVALMRRESMGDALRLAVACGAANALGEETGFVRLDTVDGLRPLVRVVPLDV
ncbi:hexose kinase [Luteibacter pinisoli]|uniref:Phosphofructokinase n=1 Tax=Luteibacter pinisoli TaxID=2589080 RepID=A0A4Y5Z3D0_9GAMM|nr:hexose kinase [Luteibacter pinisoli]QDE39035.1 hexose kinase [Luteibacter pinisoli]